MQYCAAYKLQYGNSLYWYVCDLFSALKTKQQKQKTLT